MKSELTTFGKICAVKNIDPTADLAILNQLSEPARSRAISNYRLDIIVLALNDENQETPWIPDYSNWDQWKYFICLTQSSPGSGWSYDVFDAWAASPVAGARPFRERKIAEFAWEYFQGDFIAVQ